MPGPPSKGPGASGTAGVRRWTADVGQVSPTGYDKTHAPLASDCGSPLTPRFDYVLQSDGGGLPDRRVHCRVVGGRKQSLEAPLAPLAVRLMSDHGPGIEGPDRPAALRLGASMPGAQHSPGVERAKDYAKAASLLPRASMFHVKPYRHPAGDEP